MSSNGSSLPPSQEEAQAVADRVLAVPISERRERAAELALEETSALLGVIRRLMQRWETSPEAVLREAEFFYHFLEKPKRRIGLLDERDYLLGQFALIAGTTCRDLSRREEARLWFDRAEAGFRHVCGHVACLSMLSYQRLALRLEEREYETVLELLGRLTESFLELGLVKEAIKCRFLEGAALKEIGKLREAVTVFRRICRQAEAVKGERLVAAAYGNLLQLHAMLGEPEEALAAAGEAIPVLRRLEHRIGLAKIQWGVGALLRGQGQISNAIEAYRAAQEEFVELAMRADVAAIHLVVADLLLDAGQARQAEWEIRAALPVIDEYKMVPEGIAALSLLRQSLKSHRVDREALRNLHGYFQERAAS